MLFNAYIILNPTGKGFIHLFCFFKIIYCFLLVVLANNTWEDMSEYH